MNKFMKGLMACGLAFALATPVFAEDGSPLKGGIVDDSSIKVDGKPVTGTVTATLDQELSFENTDTPKAVVSALTSVSGKGTEKITVNDLVNEVINTSGAEVKNVKKDNGKTFVTTTDNSKIVDMSAVNMLTPFQDLTITVDGEEPKGPITATLNAPGLNAAVANGGEAFVMHYSTKRNVLEMIAPDAVDAANNSITATFADLSPVAVVYVPAAKASTAVTKPSVNTEVNGTVEAVRNNTMFYFAGAAVVVAIAGAVVLKKRNQE